MNVKHLKKATKLIEELEETNTQIQRLNEIKESEDSFVWLKYYENPNSGATLTIQIPIDIVYYNMVQLLEGVRTNLIEQLNDLGLTV